MNEAKVINAMNVTLSKSVVASTQNDFPVEVDGHVVVLSDRHRRDRPARSGLLQDVDEADVHHELVPASSQQGPV